MDYKTLYFNKKVPVNLKGYARRKNQSASTKLYFLFINHPWIQFTYF